MQLNSKHWMKTTLRTYSSLCVACPLFKLPLASAWREKLLATNAMANVVAPDVQVTSSWTKV